MAYALVLVELARAIIRYILQLRVQAAFENGHMHRRILNTQTVWKIKISLDISTPW